MRKVYVTLVVNLILLLDEGVKASQVVDELDFEFTPTTPGTRIEDATIFDHVVTDSK